MQTQRNIGRSIVLVLAVWLTACAQPGSGLIAQIDSGKLQGTDIDEVTVFKGIGPFLIADAILILLLLLFPQLALWLPGILF